VYLSDAMLRLLIQAWIDSAEMVPDHMIGKGQTLGYRLVGQSHDGEAPSYLTAEFIIGRAFARPIGSIRTGVKERSNSGR
jgi:hypothetical protein